MSTANPYQPLLDELVTTFDSGITKSLEWRKSTLESLLKVFTEPKNVQKWLDARIADLGGGEVVGISEILTVKGEIVHALESLDEWAADRPAGLGDPTREVEGQDRRIVRPTPKGVTLTIGTWNFPINLQFVPVVDAIAAGNCCFLKPSELAPATAQLVYDMVAEYLPSNAFKVVVGGIPEITNVLALKFDHITVTGSAFVGKIVMTAAAKHLTPCTLELGGKNPTFVDKSADLELAANRMVLAKTHNAGQWCVDLDYILVDESVADEMTACVVSAVKRILGGPDDQNPKNGIDKSQRWLNSIVNERNVERLKAMLEEDHGGKVVCGGLEHVDIKSKFFPLTVVVNPKAGSQLMTEEIFGPIIVIKSVSSVDEAIKTMKSICDTPLALYVYSTDETYTEKVLTSCNSGTAAVNTTVEQMVAHTVPFGGFGMSGFGAYHGKTGFDEYSHLRSILYRSNEHGKIYIPLAFQAASNVVPTGVRDGMFEKLMGQQ